MKTQNDTMMYANKRDLKGALVCNTRKLGLVGTLLFAGLSSAVAMGTPTNGLFFVSNCLLP